MLDERVLRTYYGRNVLPQNSYIEALTPGGLYLEMGPLKK